MRVLQLIDSLAPAGAERSLVALAPHLLARGVDLHVAVLVEREGDLRPQLAEADVPVRSMASPGAGRRAWYARTARLVAQLRPDVVHTTVFEADLAGRLAAARHRVPCVSSLVNTAYGREESTGLRRSRVLLAQAADIATGRLVTRWHAVTRHVAEVMGRRLRIPADGIEVIPRGRDPEVLGRRTQERRRGTRERLGLADDVPVVLAVGRLERQKGLDVLLRALPPLLTERPTLRLLVAGRDGAASADLAALRESLGLTETVTFLGMRDDVADLMVAADVLAFPSRWEGAAGTLLEAMALELPVVTSDLPTLRETVDERIALLVPPQDTDRLTGALADVLDDRSPAADRATVARARFEADFTVAAAADRTVDLYRRVAATGRRR